MTLLLATAACGSSGGGGETLPGFGGVSAGDPTPAPATPDPVVIPGDYQTAKPGGGSTTPAIGLPSGNPTPITTPVYPPAPPVGGPTSPTSPTAPTTPTTPTRPTLPASGTATYTGQYQATYFANIADPLAVTTTDTGGPLSLDIDFNGGAVSGTSADGHLTISRQAGTSANSPFAGTATYKGVAGAFSGTVTQTRADADMAGQTTRDAFIGSFDVAK